VSVSRLNSRIHIESQWRLFCLSVHYHRNMEGTWVELLEPADRERIKKMSEDAVKKQMKASVEQAVNRD